MKEILFIVTCILFSIICMGQEIDINNQVLIKPSNKLVKLSKQEALSFESDKFQNNKHVRLNAMGTLPTFKKDNILITLNSEKGTVRINHLTALKKGLDVMSANDSSYRSSIENVKNRAVLIISGLSENVKHYQFFCVNKENTIVAAGVLQFKPSDEIEAKHVLDDLLRNITFKE